MTAKEESSISKETQAQLFSVKLCTDLPICLK